jgi:hypothetical protein
VISFLRLKHASRDQHWLVNVAHIMHIRPLGKDRVRIFHAFALPGDDGSYVDSDDFEHGLDDIIEKLHQLQIEILR